MPYLFILQDNDTYVLRDSPDLTPNQRIHQEIVPDMSGSDLIADRRCAHCGDPLDKWNTTLEHVRLARRRYDMSCSYDGFDFASKRFREVYDSAGLTGLCFRPLPNDPAFLMITAEKTVEFDAVRRGTVFENQCPECGKFESIVVASPVMLKAGTVIAEREFVRSDLEFASNDEKSPLLLCGDIAGTTLKAAKLRGLYLEHFDL